MLYFPCPTCANKLSAADDHVGRKVRCPECQGVLTVPVGSSVAERPRERERLPPAEDDDRPRRREDDRVRRDEDPGPRRRDADVRPRRRDEDEDDRPRRRYDEDEDDRPRRRRRRRGGEYADCPNCGAPDPTRVHWTWWGGLIGPAIINTVRCRDCGTSYNGVHGDYNTVRIILYTVIPGVIVLALLICAGVAANLH